MKKFKNNFAYGAAALLVGAMTFSACSSDDEVANVNPSFDGESVKTQFAINIPHAGAPKTRMSETNTQGTGNTFLGMQDIRLIPVTAASGITNSTDIGQVITLGNIATSEITTSSSRKIYKNVTIPTGTDHFLFYGQAIRGTGTDVNEDQGFLTSTIEGQTNTSGITFALKDVTTAAAENSTLLALLNAVAGVQGWSSATNINLNKLYTEFIKLEAGSANSILSTLQSLYEAVGTWADAAGTSDENTIATAIRTAMTDKGISVSNGNLSYTTQNTFPEDLNLPHGAVAVKWETNAFKYVTNSIGSIGTTDPKVDVASITYPASLYYWTSTELRANDAEIPEANWPSSPTDWEGINAFADAAGWGSTVNASTQSVALKNNIDYAVGNLVLTVKCASATLKDYAVMDGETLISQNEVTVPTAGFHVTAILVGSQPNLVGYDFKAIAASGENTKKFDNTIYDSKCSIYAKNGASEGTNYTLVLPSADMEKQVVNFAIELENSTGIEFRGHNGQIIPKSGKFYLVGTLDPSKVENKPAGVTDIFLSDYKTMANVTISSLANAYNVIPDLRATNLQLGLSVDLEWEEGYTFNVDIK